jgi:hypothetical protein
MNLNTVGNFVFAYAYPVAFTGGVFLCTTEFFGIDIYTIMSVTVSKYLYVVVGLSGAISLATWFNYPIPVLTGNLYDNSAIRQKL